MTYHHGNNKFVNSMILSNSCWYYCDKYDIFIPLLVIRTKYEISGFILVKTNKTQCPSELRTLSMVPAYHHLNVSILLNDQPCKVDVGCTGTLYSEWLCYAPSPWVLSFLANIRGVTLRLMLKPVNKLLMFTKIFYKNFETSFILLSTFP